MEVDRQRLSREEPEGEDCDNEDRRVEGVALDEVEDATPFLCLFLCGTFFFAVRSLPVTLVSGHDPQVTG